MLPGASPVFRSSRTDARFDGLLLGCTVAILLLRPSIRNFIFRNVPKETPLFLAILLIFNLQRTHYFPSLSTYILISLMLASTLVVEKGLAHKFLNSRPLVWIGTISYSLYVWQELFLFRPAPSIFPLGRACAVPLNLLCVFAVSTLSFYFIEQPCIALSRRLLTRERRQVLVTVGA
jgi:peptidoglycan/LPS O-acetylase OafA/YrhL